MTGSATPLLRLVLGTGLVLTIPALPATAADTGLILDGATAVDGALFTPDAADLRPFQVPASAPVPTFECRLDAGAWSTCAPPVHLTGLTSGPHVAEARAVDGGGPDPSPASVSWIVDRDPPAGLATVTPSAGTRLTTMFPSFGWIPGAEPAGLQSGLPSPSVTVEIDGAGFHCESEGDPSGCGVPSRFRAYPSEGVRNGDHRYRLVAVDRVGNRAVTPEVPFRVEVPPTAGVTAGTVLSGRPNTIDAGSRSTVNSAEPARYAWDLDADSRFETDGGERPTITRRFAAGVHRVAVRVTDGIGLTATATATFRTYPAPPRGRPGVSVDGGAAFTRSRRVTLSPVWPAFASAMLVSGDGGFAHARRVAVRRAVPWTLAPVDGVPQTVHVRFTGGPPTLPAPAFDEDLAYQDEIVLDRGAPRVVSARLAGPGPTVLVLTAHDDVSGPAAVQVARPRRSPGAWRPYRRLVPLGGTPGTVRVRVRDRAGNTSAWRPAAR